MRFGLSFGLGGKAIGKTNICVTSDNDAVIEWYGYQDDGSAVKPGTFGSATPPETLTGLLIYSYKWKADGTIIIAFGVAGNEQIPDVDIIFISSFSPNLPSGSNSAIVGWDAVNLYYAVNNTTITGDLIALDQTVICSSLKILPNNVINYDFATMETAL